MSDEEPDSPADDAGFADIVDELEEEAGFEWDDEELEADEEEQTRPVVSVRVGDDLFGFDGESIREIMSEQTPTPLPGAPEYIHGVIVVRRRVVGLLSLSDFLGLDSPHRQASPGEAGDRQMSTERIVVAETAHYAVGIRVDEITGLDQWPESRFDTALLPDNLHDRTRHYARGAHRREQGLCVYLDLDALLDDAAVQ